MFVGEALRIRFICPTDMALPFENTHGGKLEIVFDYFHINRDALFFANTINCFPHAEVNGQVLGRVPSKSEVENCRLLDYTIEVVSRKRSFFSAPSASMHSRKAPSQKNAANGLKSKVFRPLPYHPEYFRQIEARSRPRS